MDDIILDLIPIKFSVEEARYLLERYLKDWTEISLENRRGYDMDEVKFYDGFIGSIIRNAEKIVEYDEKYANDSFIKSWMYQGKIYRVIHQCKIQDKRCKHGFRYGLPKIEYHGMITHWTKDRTFEALSNKISFKEECIILVADTGNRLAFDVNKYRKRNGISEQFTEGEEEVIFPMYKENITEYRMSIEQFIDNYKN